MGSCGQLGRTEPRALWAAERKKEKPSIVRGLWWPLSRAAFLALSKRSLKASDVARQAAASRNSVSALACLKVTLAVIVAAVAVAYGAWREHMLNDYLPAQYHRQQVCPPPEDRFHDHCMEGRTHFAIEVDTDCLDQAGAGKSAALRGVFGVSEDASGVFTALRWLATRMMGTMVDASPVIV